MHDVDESTVVGSRVASLVRDPQVQRHKSTMAWRERFQLGWWASQSEIPSSVPKNVRRSAYQLILRQYMPEVQDKSKLETPEPGS